MSCDNTGPDIRLLVDLGTEYGSRQICALFDSGATISLIQPNLNPKIVGKPMGYMNLHGYQANSPGQQAEIVTVLISLDGEHWQQMKAALTSNMAEQMIVSPQSVDGYRFTLDGYNLSVQKN